MPSPTPSDFQDLSESPSPLPSPMPLFTIHQENSAKRHQMGICIYSFFFCLSLLASLYFVVFQPLSGQTVTYLEGGLCFVIAILALYLLFQYRVFQPLHTHWTAIHFFTDRIEVIHQNNAKSQQFRIADILAMECFSEHKQIRSFWSATLHFSVKLTPSSHRKRWLLCEPEIYRFHVVQVAKIPINFSQIVQDIQSIVTTSYHMDLIRIHDASQMWMRILKKILKILLFILVLLILVVISLKIMGQI